MWSDQKPKQRSSLLRAIEIDDPLSPHNLHDFHSWWQTEETPNAMPGLVKEIAMDGHEKIATRCHDAPSRGGRPRKDSQTKMTNNGWFMITDPRSGFIIGIREMKNPENADLALGLMEQMVVVYPKITCCLYDRACSVLKKANARPSLKKIQLCVDKFHAKGHCAACRCSPLNHPSLARRVAKINTSISEQIFSWFRNYSATFNSMSPDVQRFYVVAYARRHNAMQAAGDIQHLNQFSAHKQAMKKAGAWKRPSSSQYGCNPAKVQKKHLKRPSAK